MCLNARAIFVADISVGGGLDRSFVVVWESWEAFRSSERSDQRQTVIH